MSYFTVPPCALGAFQHWRRAGVPAWKGSPRGCSPARCGMAARHGTARHGTGLRKRGRALPRGSLGVHPQALIRAVLGCSPEQDGHPRGHRGAGPGQAEASAAQAMPSVRGVGAASEPGAHRSRGDPAAPPRSPLLQGTAVPGLFWGPGAARSLRLTACARAVAAPWATGRGTGGGAPSSPPARGWRGVLGRGAGVPSWQKLPEISGSPWLSTRHGTARFGLAWSRAGWLSTARLGLAWFGLAHHGTT